MHPASIRARMSPPGDLGVLTLKGETPLLTNKGDHLSTIAFVFIKKRKPVSRVLYPDKSGPLSFIYPGNHLPDPAAYPSRFPKNQNGPFCIPAYRKIVIYLALQPVSGTADVVATVTGELLPHLFTRSPIARGGHFLLPYCKLSPAFLLRSTMPCVARTFLSPEDSGGRQSGLRCKDD